MMETKINHITKLHIVNVDPMIEHITKDSFQDASRDKVWNISHVIKWPRNRIEKIYNCIKLKIYFCSSDQSLDVNQVHEIWE